MNAKHCPQEEKGSGPTGGGGGGGGSLRLDLVGLVGQVGEEAIGLGVVGEPQRLSHGDPRRVLRLQHPRPDEVTHNGPAAQEGGLEPALQSSASQLFLRTIFLGNIQSGRFQSRNFRRNAAL